MSKFRNTNPFFPLATNIQFWPKHTPLLDVLKGFNDFKNKQKSARSNVFIQCTIHRDKTQMFKRNYFGQNKRYKKCPPILICDSYMS